MKKNLLLLLLVISVSAMLNQGYAQKKCCKKCSKINCIKIDALHCCDGSTEVPNCIPENSTLAIQVFNVNPFKATIGSLGSPKVIDFGNDSLFSFNFKANADKDSPKNTIDTTVKGKKANKKNNNNQKQDDCADSLKLLKEQLRNEKNESAKKADTCSRSVSDALTQLTLLNRAEHQLRKLFDTTFITKPVFTKMMWGILECIGITNSCECKTKTDSCCNCAAHKRYVELYTQLNKDYECFKDKYHSLEPEQKNAGDFKLSGKLSDKDKGVTVDIKDAKGTYEVKEENKLKPFFDNITNAVKKANSDSVKNALLSSAEYIDECISKLCNYKDSVFSQQNFVKGPVEGDYFTVTPFLKNPKGDTLKLGDFPTQKIRVCGGHRANVSSGISFSFLGMNDDDYSIVSKGADTFSIKKTDKGMSLYIPSLTTFLHFYTRNCGGLQNAVTLGLSVNPTSLESLKVMAGYSVIFGEERRFVFSIGAIGGAVNRLKTKYSKDAFLLNKDYPNLQESELTAKRFRVGMFVGLSYNLSKLR